MLSTILLFLKRALSGRKHELLLYVLYGCAVKFDRFSGPPLKGQSKGWGEGAAVEPF